MRQQRAAPIKEHALQSTGEMAVVPQATSPLTYTFEEELKMKSNALFSRWLVLAVALGLVFGLASWSPSSPHDDLTVIVFPDLGTFSLIDVDSSGGFSAGDPFVIQGALLNEDMTATIGRYLCRGWFIADPSNAITPPFFAGVGEFTFVHQSFEIFDKGTIHVEGNESSQATVRAIVGVSGDFELEEGGTLFAEPAIIIGPGNPMGLFSFTGTFELDD